MAEASIQTREKALQTGRGEGRKLAAKSQLPARIESSPRKENSKNQSPNRTSPSRGRHKSKDADQRSFLDTQAPWNPKGTRCGVLRIATGFGSMVFASTMYNSETLSFGFHV